MKHNKKRQEGFRERMNLLTVFEPNAERFVNRVLSQESRRIVSATMCWTLSLPS